MKTPRPLALFALSLAAQACQSAEPPVVSSGPLQLAEPGPTLTSEPIEPGAVAPPELTSTLAPIAWPEGHEGGPGEVPVLWPAGLEVSSATWSRGGGWYTASMPRDDHYVIVHGSRLRVGGAGREADRGPVVTRMDGIVECDLVRFGAAYTVAVECARPMEDERCVRDDYVLGLVAALRLEVSP